MGESIPGGLKHLVDVPLLHRGSVVEAVIAVGLERKQEFDLVIPGVPAEVGEDPGGAATSVEDILHHIVGGIASYFQPADGGVGPPDPGEDHPEVIVDLGGGADRGAGIADVDLLLDGDGRRNPLDDIHVGLRHPSEELPGVGRQALGKPPLPLGIEGVKGQRGLPGARNPRDDDEFSPRNLHGNVLQVVYPGAPDDDGVVAQSRAGKDSG